MSRKPIILSASGGLEQERTITDYARKAFDYYVEPYWVVDQLIKSVPFTGHIHDPCCGGGTIPRQFSQYGHPVSGADIVNRGYGNVVDFFDDYKTRDNMVFNPPYKQAEEFILHALKLTHQKVAAIVNIKFLASQHRRDYLFKPHPPLCVCICSTRPSMPPGGSGVEAKGGTADYAWIVWDNRFKHGPPTIHWLK